jgi:preprotein translocase subunit SecA
VIKFLSGLVDSNEKQLKRLKPTVDEINALEPEYEKLSDAELQAKTDEFKQRLQSGSSLDEILPEAFATVREAAKRTIKQRHFDVQLMGGIVLHQGKIAEMKTGEGKTLVATLPLYLNSLTGKGCHLVTVNDYLARRDAYWMGPIYRMLGVSVASIYPQQTPDDNTPSCLYDPTYDSGKENDPWRHFRPIPRQEAYKADITYGTSSDFGFDYLRDNMVVDISYCVQRPLNYAIVDEVDNLLIDEARTPLIISGPAEKAEQIYIAANNVVARMNFKLQPTEPVTSEEKEKEALEEQQYDYIAYEKSRNVKETIRGQDKFARAFGMTVKDLFSGGEGSDGAKVTIEEERIRIYLLRAFRQAMLAHALYRRDRDYVVKDGEVVIVDEFTGRLMLGRRYSEGLHQAIEAKEHVKVQRESMTYATVTIQNYFRMYEKLAGMTGTALTEAEEFYKIYKLEVMVIPTNKPMIRQDFADRIYKDEESKFKAVVQEVEELYKKGQPVLIGTVSIEKSEMLSGLLKRKGVPHQVLNAKYHEKEAGIIAQAGQLKAVTVATNMAGRGVDIVLGGNPAGRSEQEWHQEHDKVIELGGLFILGTERHEARRIDNQLRGRSGRQGDPGQSRFYVSLEDDVIKRFGGDRIKGFMNWAGFDENTPIENKLINRSIEGAQVRVEGYHFDIRKNLVEFDDVVNQQRELIYGERRKILNGVDLKANILSMVAEEIGGLVAEYTNGEYSGDWDIAGLKSGVNAIMPFPTDLNDGNITSLKPKQIEEKLIEQAQFVYDRREQEMGSENMRMLERLIMLRTIDSLWIEHLTTMEYRRLEAGWQSLRQVKSVDAYKNMGYEQFQILRDTIRQDVARTIFHVAFARKEASNQASSPMEQVTAGAGNNKKRKQKVAGKKVGRNDPCPCGSGKKYKFCHGR